MVVPGHLTFGKFYTSLLLDSLLPAHMPFLLACFGWFVALIVFRFFHFIHMSIHVINNNSNYVYIYYISTIHRPNKPKKSAECVGIKLTKALRKGVRPSCVSRGLIKTFYQLVLAGSRFWTEERRFIWKNLNAHKGLLWFTNKVTVSFGRLSLLVTINTTNEMRTYTLSLLMKTCSRLSTNFWCCSSKQVLSQILKCSSSSGLIWGGRGKHPLEQRLQNMMDTEESPSLALR